MDGARLDVLDERNTSMVMPAHPRRRRQGVVQGNRCLWPLVAGKRRDRRHNAGIGLPSASAGIYRGGLAAGFTDGDAAPPAVGLGVLCPSIPRPSPEPLMQAGPPVSTASPVTACASCVGLGARPRSQLRLARR